MTTRNETQLAEMDRLYEQFGAPLEAEHYGSYVAITEDGRTLLGDSLGETAHRAASEFGPGSFLFKVGERSAGRWR